MIELKKISRVVNKEKYLADVSVSFVPEQINILLGATLAGKTSLLRLAAGLDKTN